MLGVLDRSRRGASETQIVPLIEALIRGLGSPVLDFTAASYIVLGRLVTTTSLSEQILKSLLIRLSKVKSILSVLNCIAKALSFYFCTLYLF